MDSSNKIAPLEIETLETISSEIGNQNVCPTFSKTEHPSVKQMFIATDNEPDDYIHYTSWLFGILLTCIGMVSYLLVPWHNVLKEPYYMYEYHVYTVPPWVVLLCAAYVMQLEYWAGIKYDKKMNLFFLLFGILGVLIAVASLFHNYIHVYYYELFAPPPYVGIASNQIATYVMIVILFFRYHYT